MNLELLLMMYLAPRSEVSMESYTCPKREVDSTEKHVEAMRGVKLQVLNYYQQLHYGTVTLSEPQVYYYISDYNSAILHQIARFSTYYSKLTSMSCDFSPSLCLHLPVAKALDIVSSTSYIDTGRAQVAALCCMLGRSVLPRIGRYRHGLGIKKCAHQPQPLALGHQSIHNNTYRRPSIRHNKSAIQLKANQQTRTLFIDAIPPILYPPAIFIGLLLGLWTWKCFWIIVMQNKLLYLSWLPPFSRSDTIAEYASECKPVEWTEKCIRSLDGTKLAVCEGHIPANDSVKPADPAKKSKSVVICYFQGNGGSTPLRLPLLSRVLRTIATMSKARSSAQQTKFTIVALSYRGYWTSSGRATQPGIELDAQAFLTWVSETYSSPETDLQVVLWGHSLGSAVASSALSTYLSQQESKDSTHAARLAPISGLIMEAPTSNIRDMLISLYPQRWLPYRYLWPFSWNTWCNATNLRRLAEWRDRKPSRRGLIPPIFILSAENDEVIPSYVGRQLEKRGQDLGLEISRKEVGGAMHTEGPMKVDGREALVRFVLDNTSRV